MKSLHIRAHVEDDGRLTVTMPPEVAGQDLDLVMVYQGRVANEAQGWPLGFFERTAGAWQGEVLVREPDGDDERRNRLG